MSNPEQTPAPPPHARASLIRGECISLLYRYVPRSLIINLLIAALAARVMWGVADHIMLAAWFAAAVLVSIGRGILRFVFLRASPGVDQMPLWENRFSAGAAAMGLVWAWLALIGPIPDVYQIFVIFIIGGMTMGAAGTMGASRKSFISFVAPMLLVQTGELFWIGGELFTVMGIMGALFSLGLAVIYTELRQTFMESLEARFNIEELHRQQRQVFDTAKVGIAFVRERTVIDCNLAFAELLGYQRDAIKGAPTREFLPGDTNWEQIGERVEAATHKGQTFREELSMKKKDGTLITCDVSANAIHPRQPELGLVVIANDISERKQVERELQRTLQQQLAIFDNVVTGIVYLNHHKIENCNSRFAKLFGYTRNELLGASTRILYPSDASWETSRANTFATISRGEAYVGDEELLRKDGARFWCRTYGRAIDPSHPDYAVFVMLDISAHKRTEQELLASRDQLNLVIEAAQSGIWDYDVVSGKTTYSARFKEILGYPADTADFDSLFQIKERLHPEDRNKMLDAQYRHLHERIPFAYEYRLRKADGNYVWVSGRGQAVWDESGKPVRFVGSITDISRQKEDEERIHQMAQHDPLTGLPNRRLLNDRLAQGLTRARRMNEMLALMLLDLDDFKAINDDCGHEAGDTVLVSVAQRLRKCVRASDTVARYGGDEFVILLEGQQAKQDSAALAEKILAALREPLAIYGTSYRIGGSIGIAVYPEDSANTDTLLNIADKAMYRAKEAGGNQYRFRE
jgi:diguanylate cyclase (GGDEF)-like protein/PAS domain S-box-containing protein